MVVLTSCFFQFWRESETLWMPTCLPRGWSSCCSKWMPFFGEELGEAPPRPPYDSSVVGLMSKRKCLFRF